MAYRHGDIEHPQGGYRHGDIGYSAVVNAIFTGVAAVCAAVSTPGTLTATEAGVTDFQAQGVASVCQATSNPGATTVEHDGWVYVDIQEPLADSGYRLTAIPDLETGDRLWYGNVSASLEAGSDVIVQPNGAVSLSDEAVDELPVTFDAFVDDGVRGPTVAQTLSLPAAVVLTGVPSQCAALSVPGSLVVQANRLFIGVAAQVQALADPGVLTDSSSVPQVFVGVEAACAARSVSGSIQAGVAFVGIPSACLAESTPGSLTVEADQMFVGVGSMVQSLSSPGALTDSSTIPQMFSGIESICSARSAPGALTSTSRAIFVGVPAASWPASSPGSVVAIRAIPDPFAFAIQYGVSIDTVVTSEPITVTGVNAPVSISVSGGLYSINGGSFTAGPGTVESGDEVRAQHQSGDGYLVQTDTIVTIGSVSGIFTSVTQEFQLPHRYLTVALDTCVTARECKRAADVERRGWDLTWVCARSWAPSTHFPIGVRIRPRPFELGGDSGSTGYEYEAVQGGQSGEDEPAWTIDDSTIRDGAILWQRRPMSAASLHRSIASSAEVEWSADAPMVVSNEALINGDAIVQIAADHSGGIPRRQVRSYAKVTFTDGTVGEFVHRWKITP